MATQPKGKLVDRIGKFTTLPNRFVLDTSLSNSAFRLFTVLRYHSNVSREDDVVWPSYDTLIQETGFGSYKTLAKAIRELEAHGWLSREKRFGGSTIYTLTLAPEAPSQSYKKCSNADSTLLQKVKDCTTESVGQSYTLSSVTRLIQQDSVEQDTVGTSYSPAATAAAAAIPVSQSKTGDTPFKAPSASAASASEAKPDQSGAVDITKTGNQHIKAGSGSATSGKLDTAAIKAVYVATVEGLGYMTNMANAREAFKELGQISPPPTTSEVMEAIKMATSTWSSEPYPFRFEKLPTAIRTYRVRQSGAVPPKKALGFNGTRQSEDPADVAIRRLQEEFSSNGSITQSY